jgi:hypothetical protein
MPTLNILQELQELIPPISEDERRQLIVNLRAEGCRDAIVVWQEENAILDGHNRYDICQTYEISFETKAVSLPDLDAAKAWILRHQLGRRNLTPEQMSYLRGKQYEMEKKASRGGERKSEEAKNQKVQNALFDSTASKLGNDHNVSPDTIKRDAAFAAAVDTVAEVAPEAKQDILSRDTKLTRKDVKALAGIAQDSPQDAKKVLAEMKKAKTSKAAKQAVREAAKARPTTPPPKEEVPEAVRAATPPCLLQLLEPVAALTTLPDLEQRLLDIPPDYCARPSNASIEPSPP